MRLVDVIAVLEQIAPTHGAESWDNVGLLAGDPQQEITRILLTIDYTAEVAAEARADRCDLVVSYHPPIFDGLKRITASSLIFDAIRSGIAIYSPHTALDIADGGTNDMLADALGLADRRPLRLSNANAMQYKLVVFAPEDAADRIAAALFDAGAGRIGNYSCCSFRCPGTGTFFGEEGASPAVGQAQRLERVNELRIETVVPIHRAHAVIAAMRRVHPYEEPAFDLVQLAGVPQGKGQGRIGSFASPVEREQLFDRIKKELDIPALMVAGPTGGPASTAAACAGSCGDLINDALSQKADVYLTGEVRHHDALKAAQRGMTVICTLHSNSERAVLRRVAQALGEKTGLPALISRQDRDPFQVL